MNKKSIILVILAASLFLSACAANPFSNNTSEINTTTKYSNISHEDLYEMLQDKDFLMVNVHVPFEGNIPQTDTSIPYNKIDQNLSQLPEDKDARIIVYCRSGSMSSVAAAELVSLGYSNVINLEGGFHGWADAGLPLEESANE